jgi:hypothetical protein
MFVGEFFGSEYLIARPISTLAHGIEHVNIADVEQVIVHVRHVAVEQLGVTVEHPEADRSICRVLLRQGRNKTNCSYGG